MHVKQQLQGLGFCSLFNALWSQIAVTALVVVEDQVVCGQTAVDQPKALHIVLYPVIVRGTGSAPSCHAC